MDHEDRDIAVDATLELDLGSVEQWIEAYLKDPSDDIRRKLLAVLEQLDQQIDRSDAYENSPVGSAAFGFSAKGSVIGETSRASAAQDIPGPVFQAQTDLIKAAKREVTAPTPDALAELRAASEALSAERRTQAP